MINQKYCDYVTTNTKTGTKEEKEHKRLLCAHGCAVVVRIVINKLVINEVPFFLIYKISSFWGMDMLERQKFAY